MKLVHDHVKAQPLRYAVMALGGKAKPKGDVGAVADIGLDEGGGGLKKDSFAPQDAPLFAADHDIDDLHGLGLPPLVEDSAWQPPIKGNQFAMAPSGHPQSPS